MPTSPPPGTPPNATSASQWYESGRVLAERLLASGVSPFQMSDLRFRYGMLLRHLGGALKSLGAPPGQEARVAGNWITHLDGQHFFLTRARAGAENAFNLGWEHVVDAVLRERTRNQSLPGEKDRDARNGKPEFLITLGIEVDCTIEDIKRAYRSLALAAHPDVGGDHELFVTLARARDAALVWVNVKQKRRGDGS